MKSKYLKGGEIKMGCYGGCSGAECFVEPVSESRRFFTSEEKIKMLKDYKEILEKEAKGVGERIIDLEKQI